MKNSAFLDGLPLCEEADYVRWSGVCSDLGRGLQALVDDVYRNAVHDSGHFVGRLCLALMRWSDERLALEGISALEADRLSSVFESSRDYLEGLTAQAS